MDLIRRNFALKVAAVLTAGILWFTFNYLSAAPTYNKTLELPLSVHGVAAGLVGSVGVHVVTVELTGSRPQLEGLTPESFTAFVDCGGKPAGTVALNVSVVGPGSDRIHAVAPSQVIVILDRFAYRRVPVIPSAGSVGSVADTDPKAVIVTGGATRVSQVFAVQVNVDAESMARRMVVVLKGVPVDAHFAPISGLTVAPANVRVTVVPRKSQV